jgi:hypothetical protein
MVNLVIWIDLNAQSVCTYQLWNFLILWCSTCWEDSKDFQFVIFGLTGDFILILQDLDKFCDLNFKFEIKLDRVWLVLTGAGYVADPHWLIPIREWIEHGPLDLHKMYGSDLGWPEAHQGLTEGRRWPSGLVDFVVLRPKRTRQGVRRLLWDKRKSIGGEGGALAHWFRRNRRNSATMPADSGEKSLCGSSMISRRSKGRWRRTARGSYSCG